MYSIADEYGTTYSQSYRYPFVWVVVISRWHSIDFNMKYILSESTIRQRHIHKLRLIQPFTLLKYITSLTWIVDLHNITIRLVLTCTGPFLSLTSLSNNVSYSLIDAYIYNICNLYDYTIASCTKKVRWEVLVIRRSKCYQRTKWQKSNERIVCYATRLVILCSAKRKS
jgi:hypothetical protein